MRCAKIHTLYNSLLRSYASVTGSKITTDDNRGWVLSELLDKHDLEVKRRVEQYSDGYNWNVQVLGYTDDAHTEFDIRYCSCMFGDNGEFPDEESAVEYGLCIAMSFAIDKLLRNGAIIME